MRASQQSLHTSIFKMLIWCKVAESLETDFRISAEGIYKRGHHNGLAACDVIHSVIPGLYTQYPGAFIIITGDSNHVSISSTLLTFYQFVKYNSRGNRTPEFLYANVKDANNSTDLYAPPVEDTDGLTDWVSEYIMFCLGNSIPTRGVRCYLNDKSCVRAT